MAVLVNALRKLTAPVSLKTKPWHEEPSSDSNLFVEELELLRKTFKSRQIYENNYNKNLRGKGMWGV